MVGKPEAKEALDKTLNVLRSTKLIIAAALDKSATFEDKVYLDMYKDLLLELEAAIQEKAFKRGQL
jgi:hypothetical protein